MALIWLQVSTQNYINTIPAAQRASLPRDVTLERRIRSIIRWNAIMIVLRASKKDLDLGGHMASTSQQQRSTKFVSTTSSVLQTRRTVAIQFTTKVTFLLGIYRAFVEGRLTEEQLDNFRQEVDGKGIPSYPHPKLMPNSGSSLRYLWV